MDKTTDKAAGKTAGRTGGVAGATFSSIRAQRNGGAPRAYGRKTDPRAPKILAAGSVVFFAASVACAVFAWQIREAPEEHVLVQRICAVADCGEAFSADAAHDLSQTSLHNVLLSEDGGRLALTGFISNNAERAQRQPVLVIQLFDSNGGLISRRVVNPPNYLKQVTRLPMAPGQVRALKYSLDDPGVSTLRYSLELKAT